MNGFAPFCLLLAVASASLGATLPPNDRQFLEKHCFECHDGDLKKGGLDLTALKFDPANSTNFSEWVLIHDRVSKGEMPPRRKGRGKVISNQSAKPVISGQAEVISNQSSVISDDKGRPTPQ